VPVIAGAFVFQQGESMATIPESALRARQMYIDRVPVRTILKDCKLSLDQLYEWLDGGPELDGGAMLPPIPRRHIIVRKASRAHTRVAMVERMMRATEAQLHGIEQRLASAGYDPDDSERDARAMAVLARTMRELTALDDSNRGPANETGQTNDNAAPLDVDELRRSLTRKLDALVAEQQGTLGRVDDA
jgi:hypothetical protein